MATLADIIVTLTLDTSEFTKNLKQAENEIKNFSKSVNQSTKSLNKGMNQSLRFTAKSLEAFADVTGDAGNDFGKQTNDMSKSLKDLSRTSKHLARTLSTSMEDAQMVLQAGTAEFERFGATGYHVSHEIKDEFMGLPKHLQLYVQRLREAGKSTEEFTKLAERYGERRIEMMRHENDYLQKKTTQSARLMKSFAEDTNLAPLTNQFLKLSHNMEKTAKQGTAMNIALQRIGNNKSLKNLKDQMMLVSQGVMRARGAFIGFGIAGGLALYGMIKLATAVDDRVVPAFENLKSTWNDAMMPFTKVFATGLVAVMEFFTAIGEMVQKFSEAHPVIFSMIMSIAMLTLVLGALLAPLAVTGIWTQGVAASFTALWAIIGPFVTGMLAVVGVAMALATAIVVLFVSIQNLWKHSEAFRNAFINIWKEIKTAVIDSVVEPVKKAWARLETAFSNLIATITGGSGTMGSLWTWLGDRIAVVVNYIAGNVLPILKTGFKILGTILTAVIDGIVFALNWMSQMWKTHGDTISATVSMIWGYVETAFNAIKNFIISIMPSVVEVISSGFELIRTVIDFVMKYIAPVVVEAFKVIWSIIQAVMPLVLQIIVGTWENIKSVITSTIAIIQGVIDVFTSVLKGDWSGAWEAVKSILKNALILVWNLIQLYFLGKLLAPLKGFAKSGMNLVKSAWLGMLNIIKSILTNTKAFIVGVWNAIKSSLSGSFTGILNLGKSAFTGLKNAISTIVNSVKNTVSRVFKAMTKLITNPIETAKNTVLKIITTIVKAFAGMKISIPKIKLPKIEVGSKSYMDGKVKIPTFKVNWNAKGNIFNGASVLGGGQGVGEAGAEAVLPIQHKRYMQPFASAVADNLKKMSSGNGSTGNSGGNQYTIEFNEPVVIREDADIQRIVDELEKRRRISERAKGVFSY